MKTPTWLVPALLFPTGMLLLALRIPEHARESVESPPQKKQAAGSISAKVVDPAGKLVSGAEVWFSDGRIEELQGVSNAKGLITCAKAHWRSAAFERAVLTAYREGFAPGNVDLPMESASQPIEIVLRPAWTVRGRVVGPREASLGAGFSVAAIRNDSSPNVESFRAGKRGPSWVCAAADEEGRFTLAGLDRDQNYQLVAWGPGFMPDGWPKFVDSAAEADEHIVKATPVYGCRFKFTDVETEKVRASPLLSTEAGLSFKRPRGYTSLAATYPYLRLAQIPESLLLPRSSDSISVLSHQDSESELVESIGAVGATLKLPGYEPCQFEGEARLARGDALEHEVALTPTVAGFGSIKIRFKNFPNIAETDVTTFASTPLLGTVVLKPEAGASYAIAVKHDCAGVVDVDGVPEGTYRVWFRDTLELFRSPEVGKEMTHEVKADLATELTFELPPNGQIVLYTDDGVGPRGPAMGLELARVNESGVVKAKYTPFFSRLPAALFFLPVGEYQLKSSSRAFGPERLAELQLKVASAERVAILVRKSE